MQARRKSSPIHCSTELVPAMIGTLFRLRRRNPPNSRGAKAVAASSKGWDCSSAPSRCLTCNQGHLDSRSVVCTGSSPRPANPPQDKPGRLPRWRQSPILRPTSHLSRCRPTPFRLRRPGCRRCRQNRRPYRRFHHRLHQRGFRRCQHRQFPCHPNHHRPLHPTMVLRRWRRHCSTCRNHCRPTPKGPREGRRTEASCGISLSKV
jgi:hypothetical protein